MKLQVSHNGQIISRNISMADSFYTKLMGFMFCPRPSDDTGILFKTNSIQTHFMRFNLDVVFLSSSYQVVKVIRSLKPWRMTRFYFKAKYTLELPDGLLPASVTEGEILEVTHV